MSTRSGYGPLRLLRLRQPRTPEEWQAAVDAAQGALTLDSARKYGLVTGGPVVNVDRCVELLEAGRKRGIVPSPDAVEKFVAELPGVV